MNYENPILPGCHPDPTICRADFAYRPIGEYSPQLAANRHAR